MGYQPRANIVIPEIAAPDSNPPGLIRFLDRYYDHIAVNHFETVVVPAGNISQTGIFVSTPARGYNVIAVGNFDDHNTITWVGDDMNNDSAYSNPSESINREKPEVAAPGTAITTTSARTHGFIESGGTSFAAPLVAGEAALLMQQTSALKYWPELSRAVIMTSSLHNIEGNYKISEYDGVGGISAKYASSILSSNHYAYGTLFKSSFPVGTYSQPYYINANAGDRVRAVLCWDAHPEDSGQYYYPDPALSTDFDLYAYDPNNNMIDYSLIIDRSWEIIEFNAPITGQYYVKIHNYSMARDWEWFGLAWDARTLHTLTINSGSGGTVTIPGIGTQPPYSNGEIVPLVATPNTGYHFLNWTGDTAYIDNVNAASTSIHMYGNYTIQANFAPNTCTITATAGTGGTISPSGQVAVNYGANQSFDIDPDAGYHIADVLVDSNSIGVPSSYTFTSVTANHTISASFAINTYYLTTSSTTGGDVTVPGEGGFGPYNHGTVVNLMASPDQGYHFVNWTGNTGYIADPNAAGTTITMYGNYSIQANFAQDTWLQGWDNHIKLTIDHSKVTSDLTRFPVLIHLSSDCGMNSADMSAVFTEVGANSLKIAVTQSDRVTQMYVEVEKWDATNHEAWLWVSKSAWTISSTTDTELYLYYDNDQSDNTTYIGAPGSAAAENVWDSSFIMVDLMGDGTDSSHTMDSTSHNNDGTKYGANEPNQADGIAGKAQDFDGSNDYISYGTGNILPTGTNPFTVIFWANPPSLGDGSYYFFARLKQDTEFCLDGNNLDVMSDSAIAGWFRGQKYWHGSTAQSSVANSWNQYAVKYLGGDKDTLSNYAAFINATAETLTQGTTAGGSTNDNILGNDGAYGGVYDGKLDYFSISSVARSDAWIRATYYAAADNLLSFDVPTLPGWDNRARMTIDHTKITSDLTNFPVAVHLSADSGANSADMTAVFNEVGANSLKIAVTQSDGLTQLYVEVDKWDAANEDAWLWVSKSGWTVSSTTDTVIYLYYDNNQSDNTSYVGVPNSAAAENVWDSNFVGVYHMTDGADNAHIYDSTGNDNDGTKYNSNQPLEAAGVSGKAQDFDGTDDLIDASGVLSGELFDGATTVEAWAILDSWSDYQTIFAACELGDTSPVAEIYFTYVTQKYVAYTSQNATANLIASTGTYTSDATRHYFSVTIDASGHITDFSIDGVSQGSATANSISLAGATKFYIGQLPYSWSPCNPYNGKIDEVRVSGGNRSSAWINATRYTSADNLLSF